jgi:CubicO group peptidase (beta-lactamase class C family)
MLAFLLWFSPAALDVNALAAPFAEDVTSLSIGVVGPSGKATYAFGKDGPDARTLYEIGSITKVFTSVLLADLAVRKIVTLDDPIQARLPAGVTAPSFEGHAITLRHLAAHTSGLPRLPANFHPKDEANPYADYTNDLMYAFLASAKLDREPGASCVYSNYGAGLLGQLVAAIAKKPYDALVKERITGPLGMTRTTVATKGSERAGLAVPHNGAGDVTSPWEQDALQGAGAIRSTVDDMLAFLAANMDRKSPLAAAFALTRTPQHDSDAIGAIGLGWHVRDLGRTVWHNGGTGGFRSYAAFDPVKRYGVVVLANSADAQVDGLGYGLLRRLANEPAPPLTPPQPDLKLAAAELDRYVGVYDLSPDFAITVRKKDDHLEIQATGQPAFRVFAKSKTRFYLKVVKAEIDFLAGSDGAIEALVLHQNGADQRAKKR